MSEFGDTIDFDHFKILIIAAIVTVLQKYCLQSYNNFFVCAYQNSFFAFRQSRKRLIPSSKSNTKCQ